MVRIGYVAEIDNLSCCGIFGKPVWKGGDEKRFFNCRQQLQEPLSGKPLGVAVIAEGFWDSRIDVVSYRISLENTNDKVSFVSRADTSWYLQGLS